MRDVIVIRTHRWAAAEERLLAQIAPHFGDDVVVAFHNRPAGVTPPVRVADFDDAWVAAHGLRRLGDYGWRCGDYALYAARQAFPDYDRYWIIEPDVAFYGEASAFFDAAAKLPHDALGTQYRAHGKPMNRFGKGMTSHTPYRATFALTRFSARALDMLFPARQRYSATAVGEWRFTNDETFCFSLVTGTKGMTAGGLEEALPTWFDLGLFRTDPDMLDTVLTERLANKRQICHPVQDLDGFIGAVGGRIANASSGFLTNMGPSLKQMSDADLARLADRARDGVLALLQGVRGNQGGKAATTEDDDA